MWSLGYVKLLMSFTFVQSKIRTPAYFRTVVEPMTRFCRNGKIPGAIFWYGSSPKARWNKPKALITMQHTVLNCIFRELGYSLFRCDLAPATSTLTSNDLRNYRSEYTLFNTLHNHVIVLTLAYCILIFSSRPTSPVSLTIAKQYRGIYGACT